MPPNSREYNRVYYRNKRRGETKVGRALLELDKALDVLTDEFNAGRSGPSGLRAQGIAHVRQARLILWGRAGVTLR